MAFAFFVIPERQKLSGFNQERSGQLAKVKARERVPRSRDQKGGRLNQHWVNRFFIDATATDLTLEPACDVT
jgi:hypothetical protein